LKKYKIIYSAGFGTRNLYHGIQVRANLSTGKEYTVYIDINGKQISRDKFKQIEKLWIKKFKQSINI